MWSSDGQHIIFNSGRSGLFRVWRVAAAGGDVKLETVYPGSGTLSRDGSRLAYVEPPVFWVGRLRSHVWNFPAQEDRSFLKTRSSLPTEEIPHLSPPPTDGKSYSSPAARGDARFGEAMRMAVARYK